MNEKLLEKKLRESVKKLGGIALKFASPFYTGMPDRIVLMPGAKTSFVELKTTGKKPTPIQKERLKMLSDLGYNAVVVDSEESLNEYLKSIQK